MDILKKKQGWVLKSKKHLLLNSMVSLESLLVMNYGRLNFYFPDLPWVYRLVHKFPFSSKVVFSVTYFCVYKSSQNHTA